MMLGEERVSSLRMEFTVAMALDKDSPTPKLYRGRNSETTTLFNTTKYAIYNLNDVSNHWRDFQVTFFSPNSFPRLIIVESRW